MSNIVPFNEMQGMAKAVTQSGLFGLKNENQAITLMLIAQAENIAPIQAMQMYCIINGMPALKSTEIQSRFQRAGGKVNWKETSNTKATVLLSIDGNEYESTFTIEDARLMGLADKDNWKRMPKQMLMARAITMGVRAVYPACLNNMYSVDEVADIEPVKTEHLAIADDSFIEADIETKQEPIIDIKLEKSKLQRKLKDLSMSLADIKAFVSYYGIADDLDAIVALNDDEGALIERVKEFESQYTGE